MLVIEDEEVLRRSMVRGLAKLAGAEVAEAGSLESALQAIDLRVPDIVVSDIDLPRRSGLELLGELGRRGVSIPVVFVSGYLRAYRSQIPAHANVEVFEKPVSLEDLRDLIVRKTGRASSAGEVAPFSVADYLQLAAMGRHSVLVEVECEGRMVGEVAVWDGQTWSATDDEGEGTDALRRLAFAPNAFVKCRTLLAQPAERNLGGNWEFLLLEAARMEDESSDPIGELSFGEGSFEPEPEPERSPTEIAFTELWDVGVDALLRKDYSAAMRAFVSARDLQPEDPKVVANIQRLEAMGISADFSEGESEQ